MSASSGWSSCISDLHWRLLTDRGATATALLASLDAEIADIRTQARTEKDRSRAYSKNRNEVYNSILESNSGPRRDTKAFPSSTSNADMLSRVMNVKAAGGAERV